jgi:CDP-glycerol glycerophosphotransferase
MMVNKNLARLRNLLTNQMGKPLLSKILQILAVLIPKKRNLILFGSYLGERLGDNSGALFKFFIKYHKNEFRSIWLTDNKEVISVVKNLGGEAYLKSSLRGLWLSIRTPLIITSYGVQDVLLYQPFKGYPNEFFLHHASAARKVVLSEKGGGMRDSTFARMKNNTIKYLAVISQWNGEFLSESFSLLPSQIKVIGFPRNDVFYENVDNEKEEIMKKFRLGQYNILYAPSWRKYGPVRFFPFPDFDIEKLACFLEEKNMFIILRPHVSDMRRQRNSPFWDALVLSLLHNPSKSPRMDYSFVSSYLKHEV